MSSSPAANPPSTVSSSSSQSSLLASRSSNSQLQLSTSSLLPPRSTSPAAAQSGSPSSDESLSSDWHTDEESPPVDVSAEGGGVFDSMTGSQFITHEQAAEAAAAVSATTSAAQLPPTSSTSTSAAPTPPSVSAAPSEDSAAVAAPTVSAPVDSVAHNDSSWMSAIKGVQDKDKAESKDGDSKAQAQHAQPAADESKQRMEEEKDEKTAQPAPVLPLAAVARADEAAVADSGAPCDPAGGSSPNLYSRLSSLLSSISSSPALPGAVLSISLLALGFCLGRAWQRREYSLSQQRSADAIHQMIKQQQRASHQPSFNPRGPCGGSSASDGGFMHTTCRLLQGMGEQHKEIMRWLEFVCGGVLHDGILTPVLVRHIQ